VGVKTRLDELGGPKPLTDDKLGISALPEEMVGECAPRLFPDSGDNIGLGRPKPASDDDRSMKKS
jgi:hypothetical protein